jgi:signal transduction histidine kinase
MSQEPVSTNPKDEVTRLKLQNAELTAALAQAHQTMEQQRRELEWLHQFDRQFSRSDDLNKILEHVLSWLKKNTGADYVLVARWDERRQALEVLMFQGFTLEREFQVGSKLVLPIYLMPKEYVERQNTGILFDPTNSNMVCELRLLDGALVGVLWLQRHSGIEFSAEEKRLARMLADRLSLSLHMATLLQRVQDLNTRRVQLFRMLSHDLRQPLTVLSGYLDLMQHAIKKDNWDFVSQYMPSAIKGAEDLKQLLEEVLLMERVANQSAEDWKQLSLLSLLQQAIDKMRPQADLQHHQLEINLPNNPAEVRGQEIELREAFGNLLNNAIKYTPDGGKIQVSLQLEGERWVYRVKDNGYGIAPERQTRLFEPFFRAQQPGTEAIKGTGLGLSLVKTIVEKHGGQVFFTSTVGQGSEFGFWLPVR